MGNNVRRVIVIELCLYVSVFQGTPFLKGCLTLTVTLLKIWIIIHSEQVCLDTLTSLVLKGSRDRWLTQLCKAGDRRLLLSYRGRNYFFLSVPLWPFSGEIPFTDLCLLPCKWCRWYKGAIGVSVAPKSLFCWICRKCTIRSPTLSSGYEPFYGIFTHTRSLG